MATLLPRTLLALCLFLSACKPQKIRSAAEERADKIQALREEASRHRDKHADREALAAYQQALALCNKVADAHLWSDTATEVASTHLIVSEYDKAEALYREIIAQNDEQFGKDSAESVANISLFAYLLDSRKRTEETESLLRRLVTIHKDAVGKQSPQETKTGIDSHNLSTSLKRLGVFLQENNHLEEAEAMLEKALQIEIDCQIKTKIADPGLAHFQSCYSILLLEMGDTEEQANEKIDKMMEPLSKK